MRQSEAAEIAAMVDAMVVVGDPKSANTKHLTEICRLHCSRVFQIENADELPRTELLDCNVVGLTAGASTPASIIKEVNKTMSEEKILGEGMENFAEMFEQYTNTLNTGDKVTGIVTAITPTEVHVDLGCKQAGYIPMDQLTDDPSAKAEDIVKIGDEVELFVIRVNDVEGYATLSKKRLMPRRSGRTSRPLARIRTFWKALSPRRTRVVSLFPSRAFACSFPLPSPVCPVRLR